MKKSAVLTLAMVIVSVFFSISAYGVEYKPYFRLGGMSFTENGIKEGNKFLTAFGLEVDLKNKGAVKSKVSGEIWAMGEPVDEDVEMPQNGFNVNYEIAYKNDKAIYPFAGIGFNKWSRLENEKYPGSFSKLYFASGIVGLGMNFWERYFLKCGVILPVWSQTDHSQHPGMKVGFDATAGAEWNKFFVSLFYRLTTMGGDRDQPSFKLFTQGVMAGLKI